MHYVLLDSTGNLIDSFDELDEARARLDEVVDIEPEAADHVAIITYDATGRAVGDPITVTDAGIGAVLH